MTINESQLQDEPQLTLEEERIKAETLQRIQEKLDRIEQDFGSPYSIISKIFTPGINIAEEKTAIATIQQSDPTDFQLIAASTLDLCNAHYTSVRIKSERSFSWTILAYGAALLFFLIAATFFIIRQTNISYFSALGAALSGLFGGLFQAHGRQIEKESKECRVNLDRIQRFIIANSACEGLNDAEKQQKRSEIISKLVE